MSSPHVRPYQPADREAVRTIAADTAFFGDPVEQFLEDRRLFCDAMYLYYTDFEPEHGWVACSNQEVVGFLVGCVDTAAQAQQWRQSILPLLLARFWHGCYIIGRRTWRFAVAQIHTRLRYGLPRVDPASYPAHLHMNVSACARGQGLGQRLLEAYIGQLRELEVPGVHLRTTNLNIAACHLYTKMGFQLLDSRPTVAWAHLIDQPVESRCYGLNVA